MTHHSKLFFTLFIYLATGLASAEAVDANHAGHKMPDQQYQASENRLYGKVIETMDASGYTYAEVDTGTEKVWAAARLTPIKPGDMIAFSTAMPMNNFHSKTMKRDFAVVYFVDKFITDKAEAASAGIATPHDNIKQEATVTPIKDIKKADGGYTVKEIYADKDKLNGKTVRIRGQITKFTANVMGINWLHIKDSSTSEDLTITTAGTAEIDDVVLLEGKLELDKDYKYGYVYPVIVLDAKIIQ